MVTMAVRILLNCSVDSPPLSSLLRRLACGRLLSIIGIERVIDASQRRFESVANTVLQSLICIQLFIVDKNIAGRA